MPKYKPTNDDLWETRPCAICGRDVIFDGEETCSWICKDQWETFKQDYEDMMLRDEYYHTLYE